MAKYKLLIAVALIVTWAGVQLSPAQERESVDESRPAATLLLEDYLLKLGEQYDFYFTVETGWQVPEHMNWMEQYSVRQFSTEESIQRHLEMLKETVPHFTYSFDYANRKVIQIKDARLAQQPAYGMDGMLKSINYKGSWMGLVNTLGERIKVSAMGVVWIGDPRARDYSTQVHVKARNITGRDAITNFIQLQGRRRILWLSQTKLSHGEWSYIQLYAPVKKL
jgi:hypothetical protein